jgi:hypothetical protein
VIDETKVANELIPIATKVDELAQLYGDDLTLDECNVILSEVQARIRELDRKKATVARPLLDATKALNELFKAPMRVLEALKERLKARATQLLLEQRAEQQKALRAGDVNQAIALTPSRGTVRKERQVSIDDEDAIPAAYRVIDYAAVRRDALAGVQIPGVSVHVVEVAVARAGRRRGEE